MMRAQRLGIWFAAGSLMLALSGTGWSQQGTGGASGSGRGSQTVPPSLSPIGPSDAGGNPDLEIEQAKMRNEDRQKQLVADTVKLLALANELKVDVDKSNKDTLSLDVIRKADEIEKLAHSVKEKMKGS